VLVGEALAIDAEVLANPLNVVARFVEGNALDPVNKISAAGSRIAVRRDPLGHAAAAGVIRRERQGARAAFVLQDLAEEGRAELGVEGRIESGTNAGTPENGDAIASK
jgi:hypothetical protein